MSDLKKKKQLLLGGGNKRDKRMKFEASPSDKFEDLTVIDIQEPCDKIFDLNKLHDGECLMYGDNVFDEIHAYEILEHIGKQGDFRGFFYEFAEYWRVLKPDGYLFISCPMWDSPWAYADPGHTRVLPKEIFSFLCPEHYKQVDDVKSSSSDYRQWLGDTNFEGMAFQEAQHNLYVILQAKKP